MPGVMVDDISFSQESSASSCASTVIFDSLMAAAAAANPAMQQDHIKSLFSHSDISDTWALPQSPYLHNSGGYGSPGFNSPRSSPAMEILRREESSQMGSNIDPFGGMYAMDFFSPKENVIESRGSSLLRAKLGGSLHCDVKDMYSDVSTYCESPISSLIGSPTLPDAVAALHKFLPSNNEDSAENIYSCDEFRMYEFKVRRCMRGRSHDWTECPFAHPGEKARRRDPRRVPYLGTACPDFRKGNCKQGDACEYAHGVFECWLHPARYRTQPCKDGRNCRRRVCFFAHTPEQLRILPNTPQTQNGSPRGLSRSGMKAGFSSPQAANFGRSLDGSSQNGCFDAAFDGFGHGNNGFEASVMKHGNHHAPKLNNTHYPYASSHISSPTSPLEGLAHSPPPVFPPLSPSDSPPLSPSSSPENWLNPQGLPLSVAAVRSALSQSPTSLSEVQALLMAHNQNHNMLNHNFSADNCNMQSPPHRRSLERMNSMPSVPSSNGSNFDQRRILQSFSSFSPSHASARPASPNMGSSRAMNNLLATLQQLDLKGGSSPLWPQPNQMPYSSGRSPLHRSSDISNKLGWDDRVGELWEMDVGEVQRVESGKHFRAEVYGRVGKENLPDSNDSPDLGWVNELVKE